MINCFLPDNKRDERRWTKSEDADNEEEEDEDTSLGSDTALAAVSENEEECSSVRRVDTEDALIEAQFRDIEFDSTIVGYATSSPTMTSSALARAILSPKLRHGVKNSGEENRRHAQPITPQPVCRLSACNNDLRVLCHQACPVPDGEDWSTAEEDWRPRVFSMPTRIRPPKLADLKERRAMLEAQKKLRSFVITPRGVVQEKNNDSSVLTTGMTHCHAGEHVSCAKKKQQQQQQEAEKDDSAEPGGIPGYRVDILGAPYVGKRALVREFINDDRGCFESSSGE